MLREIVLEAGRRAARSRLYEKEEGVKTGSSVSKQTKPLSTTCFPKRTEKR